MASSDRFFETQQVHSRIKSEIVDDYFRAWSTLMSHQACNRLYYVDLFSGQGYYDDGNKSTPLMILDSAEQNQAVASKLDCLFVEEDETYHKKLKGTLAKHPVSSKLAKLVTKCSPIDPSFIEALNVNPCTLSFIDPFGFKDVSSELIATVLSHWGSDCIFYCSTSGIRRNLNIASQQESLKKLLGTHQLQTVKEQVVKSNATSYQKDQLILRGIRERLREWNDFYWLDLGIEFEEKKGISHFLVFLCKHYRGFAIMKEIMAKHSYVDGRGVPTWTWRNLQIRGGGQDQLNLSDTLEKLKKDLVQEYSHKELLVKTVVENCHQKGYLFTKANFKMALSDLEIENQLTVDISRENRPKRNGIITLGDQRRIKFH